jgi:hypothetical protein
MGNFIGPKFLRAAGIGIVLILLSVGLLGSADLSTKIATIVTLLALLIEVYFWVRDDHRSKKRLVINQSDVSTLINRAVRLDGRTLNVFLGDEPVKNFAISRIEVVNAGGAPIVSADFESSIFIDYRNVDKIYYAEVRGPEGLRPAIAVQDSRVVIEPLLLNPGDRFVIEAGVDLTRQDSQLNIAALGRIAGVPEIEVSEIEKSKQHDPTLLPPPGPDTGHVMGAAGLGAIGGFAFAGVLAVFVFNSFQDDPNFVPRRAFQCGPAAPGQAPEDQSFRCELAPN